MQTVSKKILFINRASPAETIRAQEALDALLMASAFNQEVNVLFMDDGVLQLQSEQKTLLKHSKLYHSTILKMFMLIQYRSKIMVLLKMI